MAVLPPDPGSRRQMGRPQSLPEGPQGQGTGPAKPDRAHTHGKNIKKTPLPTNKKKNKNS